MYYLLNYLPMLIQMTLVFIHHRNGLVFNNDLKLLYIVFLLFATPLYVLLTYRYFRAKKCISLAKDIVFMISVVAFNTFSFMLSNKIKTGYFIGDVPEQIYYLLFGIPATIIVLGALVMYFRHKK